MKDFMTGASGCAKLLSRDGGLLDDAFGNKEKCTRAKRRDRARWVR